MITCIFKQVSDNQILLIEQRVFSKERTKLISQEQFQDYYDRCIEYKIRTYVQDVNGKILSCHEPRSIFVKGFCYFVFLLTLNIFLVSIRQLFSNWSFLMYILQALIFLKFTDLFLFIDTLSTKTLAFQDEDIQVEYSSRGYTLIGKQAFIYSMCFLGGISFIAAIISYLYGQTVLSLLVFMPLVYVVIYCLVLYYYSHYNRIPRS